MIPQNNSFQEILINEMCGNNSSNPEKVNELSLNERVKLACCLFPLTFQEHFSEARLQTIFPKMIDDSDTMYNVAEKLGSFEKAKSVVAVAEIEDHVFVVLSQSLPEVVQSKNFTELAESQGWPEEVFSEDFKEAVLSPDWPKNVKNVPAFDDFKDLSLSTLEIYKKEDFSLVEKKYSYIVQKGMEKNLPQIQGLAEIFQNSSFLTESYDFSAGEPDIEESYQYEFTVHKPGLESNFPQNDTIGGMLIRTKIFINEDGEEDTKAPESAAFLNLDKIKDEASWGKQVKSARKTVDQKPVAE